MVNNKRLKRIVESVIMEELKHTDDFTDMVAISTDDIGFKPLLRACALNEQPLYYMDADDDVMYVTRAAAEYLRKSVYGRKTDAVWGNDISDYDVVECNPYDLLDEFGVSVD